MERRANIERETNETKIKIALALDGKGECMVSTGIGFFDHMVSQLAHHGLFDLAVQAEGDTHVDFHHTVEDVGIALGAAFDDALGGREGINRYGSSLVPMDEALARVVLDCSGRSHLSYDDKLKFGKIGEMDTELFREFFAAFVRSSKMTVHVDVERGSNAHHTVEAIFKAFARALRAAVEADPRRQGVPSTKGVI